MKKLYIWHHLGMGDHILCNGIVRHYAKKYDKIFLFSKKHNLKNVKYMYRDLNNIEYLDGSGPEDRNVRLFLDINPHVPLLKITNNDKWEFDKEFYKNAKLPFSAKWDYFYLERDMKREKEVYYDILGLKDKEEYIFIHKGNDKTNFREEFFPDNIKIVRPDDQSIGLFEFLYVMEKSNAIHMGDSSFLCLVDTIQLQHNNLNFHEYIRTTGPHPILSSKLNWNVIS